MVEGNEALFHLSEDRAIEHFEPRYSPLAKDDVVWAISGSRKCNYLLPRDCPRVTFYAGTASTPADVDRFLGSSTAVVAIENGWLDRFKSCRLYSYHLPPETFVCIDECAGYFVSRVVVEPVFVSVLDDLGVELHRRDVEVRTLPSLWALHDAVAASTLQFSMIRMRHALPRGVTDFVFDNVPWYRSDVANPPGLKICDTILDAIGHTPLVRINRITAGRHRRRRSSPSSRRSIPATRSRTAWRSR